MAYRNRAHLLSFALLVSTLAVLLGGPAFNVSPVGHHIQPPQVHVAASIDTRFTGLALPGRVPHSVSGTPETSIMEEDLLANTRGLLAATCLAAVALRASESESEEKAETGGFAKIFDAVKLPVYAGLWYFFNIQYNLVNKKVLNFFPATWALAWWQLAAGIPIALFMWGTGLLKKPKLTKQDLLTLLPVGAAHSAGQILTVASLGAVAVSFTHTVKALEPGVNAIASGILLGQVFHPLVYASLIPVFAGVAMASAGEMSFTMFGFLTAFGSNFAFVMRNVLSTKFGSVGEMGDDKVTRKTNQLAVLTAVAALVLLPAVAFIPGGLKDVPAAWQAAMGKGIAPMQAASMIALSGVHFFLYQMSSFWVLSCVQPITHSVLNTLKRIVIIVVSVIVFRNPVSFLSAAGTITAILGVLIYSLTKQHFAKKASK